MSSCFGNVTAPTSTDPGPLGAPWRSALTFSVTLADEVVVDRRLDVHALDRDAGLPAVLHRVEGGGVRRALEVGVGEHDHRVLAAELQRHRRERARGALHDLLAGRGRAGEHHHVDLVDQRLTRLAEAGRDLVDALGQAALAHRLDHQQRGQGRDLRRLEDHGVAGGERRDAVAEGVRQRVVPRADHADEPERRVAHDELAAEHERVGRADLLVGEVVRRVLGPEAERAADVADLGEQGVLVGLARLGDDRVDHALLVVEHPLLGAPQHARAALEAERLPGRLRGAAALGERAHLVRGEDRHLPHDRAGRGVLDRDLLRGRRLRDGGHLSPRTRWSRWWPAPPGGRARRSAAPRARRRPPSRRSPCRRPCACRRATARPRS